MNEMKRVTRKSKTYWINLILTVGFVISMYLLLVEAGPIFQEMFISFEKPLPKITQNAFSLSVRLNDFRYYSASAAVAISAGIIYLFGGFEREKRKFMMYIFSGAGFISFLFISVVFFLPIIFLDSYV